MRMRWQQIGKWLALGTLVIAPVLHFTVALSRERAHQPDASSNRLIEALVEIGKFNPVLLVCVFLVVSFIAIARIVTITVHPAQRGSIEKPSKGVVEIFREHMLRVPRFVRYSLIAFIVLAVALILLTWRMPATLFNQQQAEKLRVLNEGKGMIADSSLYDPAFKYFATANQPRALEIAQQLKWWFLDEERLQSTRQRISSGIISVMLLLRCDRPNDARALLSQILTQTTEPDQEIVHIAEAEFERFCGTSTSLQEKAKSLSDEYYALGSVTQKMLEEKKYEELVQFADSALLDLNAENRVKGNPHRLFEVGQAYCSAALAASAQMELEPERKVELLKKKEAFAKMVLQRMDDALNCTDSGIDASQGDAFKGQAYYMLAESSSIRKDLQPELKYRALAKECLNRAISEGGFASLQPLLDTLK